jgi:tRNA-2-methylthio-N6-dimethylallyladenosine synthase
MNRNRTLYVHTIGCQMNVYDSGRIVRSLRPLGYTVAPAPEQADLVVVNTCSIRRKAEHKAFSFLGTLLELKKKNPDMIIAVGGCVAQQEGKKILARAPHVNIVFGTRAIGRLPALVEQAA